MSGKVGDVQQTKWYTQKVTFYDDHYLYQASELQPMLSTNKVVRAEGSFCYRDYVCQDCSKDHKPHHAISCYTLLHQASRGKGRNSLRKRRDILVSTRDLQRFFFIILP